MITIALALALTASPQDRVLTVETLTYFETYSCAALGVIGEEYALEQLGDAASEPEYQPMLTALRLLSQRAVGALDAAQSRDGLSPAQAWRTIGKAANQNMMPAEWSRQRASCSFGAFGQSSRTPRRSA